MDMNNGILFPLIQKKLQRHDVPWMSPKVTMLREISRGKRVSMIKLNSRYPRIVRFVLTDSGIDRGSGIGRHG